MFHQTNVKIQPPLSDSDQILLKEYLAGIHMHPHNTARLFGIGFVGLPGSGKSTVADMLGERLHLPVNRSDQIRRFLNTRGFPGPSPRPDIMASLAEARTKYFYEQRTSVIIDANFTEYARVSQAMAEKHGATLLLVRLQCPDDVAIDRLQARTASGATKDSGATHEDYARIKALVETFDPVENVYFDIDTSQPLEPSIEILASKLREDGFIAD